MVLPIHDPHDDNSTEAPEDEDTLFDREEALRHDDAIMDFQWFSTYPWTKIKDLRGTAYVQPPTRLRFEIQQAQHFILRAIAHNGPSSPTSEPAWKVLLLSSWLLLGPPAENASDANCASIMEARLDLFWSDDWPALWALLRAECDVATITQKRARGQKPNKPKPESVKLPRRPETPRQSRSLETLFRRSRVSTWSRFHLLPESHTCLQRRSWNTSQSPQTNATPK